MKTAVASWCWILLAAPVAAQSPCTFAPAPASFGAGLDGAGVVTVNCAVVFDDGTGPSWIVGGKFDRAGDVAALNVARYDGLRWHAMGAGLNQRVRALCVYDDGNGPRLYAGGEFFQSGGAPRARLARWDATAQVWEDVGGGVDGPWVTTMTVHDFGAGPRLLVGGFFFNAGAPAVAAPSLAAWDGASWSDVGGGPGGDLFALRAWIPPGATAPELVAAGTWPAVNGVMRYDGASWSQLGGGLTLSTGPGRGRALEVFDDGAGPRLYVGGTFTWANNGGAQVVARNVAAWDGSTWHALAGSFAGVVGPGTSPPGTVSFTYPAVHALRVFGGKLFVGGEFGAAGGVAGTRNLAVWDAAGWGAFGDGSAAPITGMNDGDAGAGPRLVLVGDTRRVGGEAVLRVAQFDGSLVARLGSGPTQRVRVVRRLDLGAGPETYVATGADLVGATPTGQPGAVYRRDGAAWTRLGGGFDGDVRDLAVYDSGFGPELYASGGFATVAGVAAPGVARWDGSAWVATANAPLDVDGLGVFDDGAGAKLHALGTFGAVRSLGVFDGAAWTAVGGAVTIASPSGVARIHAFTTFDEGAGLRLYAGGRFSVVGGVVSGVVAAWDGAAWHSVTGVMAGGTEFAVHALCVHAAPDGRGPRLYAGGRALEALPSATFAGPATVVERDGALWRNAMAGGGTVFSLASFDDGAGAALYAVSDVRLEKRYLGRNTVIAYVADPEGGLTPTWPLRTSLAVADDLPTPELVVAGGFLGLLGTASPGALVMRRPAPFGLALTQP
ncbi:MAG TPA: hypothetical protein VEI02_10295, partial [Planctomycetota bacterium]|nr:hypothetical protein [Planctomycetota bacterium]